MHEVLIGIVILAIVGVQAMVAKTAWTKIDLYKEIIPGAENFDTVKVYIRESQIKDIKVDYILNNLDKFRANPLEITYHDVVSVAEVLPSVNSSAPIQQPEEAVPGYDDLIWITREGEEKTIKYKLLKSYELAGWTQI